MDMNRGVNGHVKIAISLKCNLLRYIIKLLRYIIKNGKLCVGYQWAIILKN